MRTRSKPLHRFRKETHRSKRRERSKRFARDERISEQGAHRSKETRAFENKGPKARKEPENLRTGSRPLEGDCRI